MHRAIGIAVVLFGLATASAHAAQVLSVSDKASVPGTPEEVWAKIGKFCAISDWHPAVAKCEESKKDDVAFRLLTLGDGATINEEHTGTSETGYTYKILESPLPVKDYSASFSVRPDYNSEGNSVISWSASFQAKDKPEAEAKAVITGIFADGMKSLKEKLQAK